MGAGADKLADSYSHVVIPVAAAALMLLPGIKPAGRVLVLKSLCGLPFKWR